VRWSFAQIGLLIICIVHVIQAVIGFIIEPSFATGPTAPTVQLLGMDYNGWHAVAGLALFGASLVFALRKSWAVLYLLLAAVAGALPGIGLSKTSSVSGETVTSGPLRKTRSLPSFGR
jgi:hypothetical protein